MNLATHVHVLPGLQVCPRTGDQINTSIVSENFLQKNKFQTDFLVVLNGIELIYG